MSHPPRADAEARYIALLDHDRERWPDDRLFEHWKRHFVSELPRGDFIRRSVEHYVPDFSAEHAAVLDIGCGDAGVPIAFVRAGARVAAIEPAIDSLRRGSARARLHGAPVRLCRAVAERVPFASGRFDLVILDNVLEHVADRELTLREVHRLLRPHGLLYLVTPKPLVPLSLLRDPHYGFFGLDLLPRPLQRVYVERVRRLGPGSYQVGLIPTRRWVRRALRRAGFESLVSPRALWVRYVRYRLREPSTVQGSLKSRIAPWLSANEALFGNPLVRWLLDVGLGSNYFIARRTD